VAAAASAPSKSFAWTLEKKIIAAGLAFIVLMVGVRGAALRPKPKNTGTGLPAVAGTSGISIPSSDATLKVLKEGGPPPLPNNSGGKGGRSGAGGLSNPKDSSGRDVAPPAAGLTIPAGTPVMIRMIGPASIHRETAPAKDSRQHRLARGGPGPGRDPERRQCARAAGQLFASRAH